MVRFDTPLAAGRALTGLLLVFSFPLSSALAEWRRVGNGVLLEGLADPASGAVERVWWGESGALLVRTAAGKVYESKDFSGWKPVRAAVPERVPGQDWRFGKTALIGGEILDFAEQNGVVVAATRSGVWMSRDHGESWAGLNEGLPNLPLVRIHAAPGKGRGLRIASQDGRGWEWWPGQQSGWMPAPDAGLAAEQRMRAGMQALMGEEVRAAAVAGEFWYAGGKNGELWTSSDQGRNWRRWGLSTGEVTRIWADPGDGRTALAAAGGRVWRTVNGGGVWDDISANLKLTGIGGIAVDVAAGAVYLAADGGLYWALVDLKAPGLVRDWTPVPGPSTGRVLDVLLDEAGFQLYAGTEAEGVYAQMAPHRMRKPQLLHTADYAVRAAAPGALVSLLGAEAQAARAQGRPAPVLAAGGAEAQIQIPFEVEGRTLELSFDSGSARLEFRLPLESTAPAVVTDRDGAPLIFDADTGVTMDALHPLRAGMRVQLLATGLGRVTPDWPAGVPAPADGAPQVKARVQAFLDGAPLRVARATLAPGYVGFYLVEFEMPALVDGGASLLWLDAGGNAGNRVRVYIGRE